MHAYFEQGDSVASHSPKQESPTFLLLKLSTIHEAPNEVPSIPAERIATTSVTNWVSIVNLPSSVPRKGFL